MRSRRAAEDKTFAVASRNITESRVVVPEAVVVAAVRREMSS
jgi:hypothetical protein